MFLETEGARNVVLWAAWALDHDPEAAFVAAHSAKAYASDAAVNVCRSALQVHGGIGFTWEHDLHLYLKRAESNARAFGDATWHREQVAAAYL
jgi:alkylation response protein AidB-like acyl-CoA dehydrogenase